MAWRFLAWAVDRGGDPVRHALSVHVDRAIAAHLPLAEPGAADPPRAWGDHGHLSDVETRRTVRRAVRVVVRPCVVALCRRGPVAGR